MKATFDKKRSLSWSAISSFEYDPEQWYEKYVLNKPQETSPEMEFGKVIGKKLETDSKFLPMIKRQSKMEFLFMATYKNIPLIGYADSFCDTTFGKLEEYKTGKKSWDQKRVDQHGQITMYCLMNWITNKIRPEDVECTLSWMPTWKDEKGVVSFLEPIEKRIKIFKTKRTMTDILKFGQRINNVYDAMEEYCQNHK